jgi:hypothetical protein
MVHNGKEILEFKASDYSPTHELQHYMFHQPRTQQALGTKKGTTTTDDVKLYCSIYSATPNNKSK